MPAPVTTPVVTQPRPASNVDTQRILVAAGTFAVTTTHATMDLGAAYATIMRPQVVLDITAIESDTNDESYTFALHQSDDNFAADDDTIGRKVLAAGGVANSLDLIPNAQVPFNTDSITKRYVRIVTTIAGTIATGVTFGAYLTANH